MDVLHQVVGHLESTPINDAAALDGNMVLVNGKNHGRPPADRVANIVERIGGSQKHSTTIYLEGDAALEIERTRDVGPSGETHRGAQTRGLIVGRSAVDGSLDAAGAKLGAIAHGSKVEYRETLGTAHGKAATEQGCKQ